MAVGVVGSLELDVLATGVAEVGAGVAGAVDVVGGGVVAVVLGLLLPGAGVPAKGSVYCWSPAEPPPEASVTAGTASARALRAACRWPANVGCAPGRVWQPGPPSRRSAVAASDARADNAWAAGRQTASFCRISCKSQEVWRPRRRTVLGWLRAVPGSRRKSGVPRPPLW